MEQSASSSTILDLSLEKPIPPSRSKTCGQCNQADSKYTCPACSVRTCSLRCSNQHKRDQKCSGKRNRVEYVQLNQYSWGRLMQDYSYLEEIHRHLSDPRLSQSSDPSTNTKPIVPLRDLLPSRNSSGKREFLLRKAALESVDLNLMPDGMSRRKMNMTNYNQKKRCMQWSVELVFRCGEEDKNQSSEKQTDLPSTSEHYTSHLIHQISSDTTIIELLKRTLNLKKLKMSQDKKRHLLRLMECQGKEEEEGVMFMIPVERLSGPETAHQRPISLQAEVHVIASTSTLSDALSGTKVVEWPKIEVWLTDEWATQMSAGRVKIVAKPPAIPSHGSQRPVDSGWPAKRARISDDPSSHTLHPQPALDLEPQNPPPLLSSLLQYSSSEAETD